MPVGNPLFHLQVTVLHRSCLDFVMHRSCLDFVMHRSCLDLVMYRSCLVFYYNFHLYDEFLCYELGFAEECKRQHCFADNV